MEKIFKALLETKFNGNASMILEVANQTPNARVAIEKLCGLYTPYTMEGLGVYRTSKDKEPKVYKLISINEWEEKVIYEYEYEETIGYYVPKDLDPSIVITMDNIQEYKCNSSSNAKYIVVKTGEIKTAKTDTSIGHWLGLPWAPSNF